MQNSITRPTFLPLLVPFSVTPWSKFSLHQQYWSTSSSSSARTAAGCRNFSIATHSLDYHTYFYQVSFYLFIHPFLLPSFSITSPSYCDAQHVTDSGVHTDYMSRPITKCILYCIFREGASKVTCQLPTETRWSCIIERLFLDCLVTAHWTLCFSGIYLNTTLN